MKQALFAMPFALLAALQGCSRSSKSCSGCDFGISVSPTTVQDIALGGSVTLNITIAPIKSFASDVDVTVTGLPAGVTAPPLTIAAGTTGGQLLLAAVAGAIPGGPSTATITGTDRSNNALHHSVSTTITVVGAAGSLAATFGSSGVFTHPAVGGSALIFAMAFQPGTHDLIVGGSFFDGTLSAAAAGRLDAATGVLDPTFGTSGVATVSPSPGNGSLAPSLAIFPDGRVALGAYSAIGSSSDLAVIVLTTGGQPDAGFAGGFLQTAVSYSGFQPSGIGVDANGNVVIASVTDGSGTAQAVVQRYSAAGVLDGTFGTGGQLLVDLGGLAQWRALAFDANHDIVTCGVGFGPGGSLNTMVIARITTAGVLDQSFGTGGIATADASPGLQGNFCNAIAIQPDGNILVAGGDLSNGGVALARLTPTGALDTTFGGNGSGFTKTSIGGHPAIAESIALNGDGTVFVAVQALDKNGLIDMFLAHFFADGTQDPDFGQNPGLNGGAADFNAGIGNDRAFALVVDPASGRVDIGGAFDTGAAPQWGVLQYWP